MPVAPVIITLIPAIITICASKDENFGYILVEDTGRGISKDHIETIFDPFVQAERGLTRTNEGVGLGLAISRDLARAMGGDITVSSQVGVGSKFMLSLPLAPDE
jgi:signal transduction histidine kinase